MRRIAALIDMPDVIAVVSFIILVVFIAQFDWRVAGLVVGGTGLLLALALARPEPEAPAPAAPPKTAE